MGRAHRHAEIAQLIKVDRTLEARRLYEEAERISSRVACAVAGSAEGMAPHDVRFKSERFRRTISTTDSLAPPARILTQWQLLGVTPVTFGDAPRWGFLRIRAIKAGFTTREQTLGAEQNVRITLHRAGAVPAGMVYTPQAVGATSTPPSVSLPAFWIDRHEVTNGQLGRTPVDAGGYQKPRYWTHSILVKDGKTLSSARGDGGAS